MNRKIILFDGTCVLCKKAVHFIISRDPKGTFSFASLQSDLAKNLLKEKGLDPDSFDSLVLIEKEDFFYESTAVLKIASQLSFPWNLFGLFLWLPKTLRDPIYKLIARNRFSV